MLEPAGFGSIPEAHCYLRVGGRRYDFTGLSSGSASPFDALLSEHSVSTAHLADEKARIHKDAIQGWAESQAVCFEDAWALREACIQVLASNNTGKPPA